jgi:hypothetical protein
MTPNGSLLFLLSSLSTPPSDLPDCLFTFFLSPCLSSVSDHLRNSTLPHLSIFLLLLLLLPIQ